jgi:hypothetical protein
MPRHTPNVRPVQPHDFLDSQSGQSSQSDHRQPRRRLDEEPRMDMQKKLHRLRDFAQKRAQDFEPKVVGA